MGELIDGKPMFPGDNDLDQLNVIQKVIGGMTKEQKEVWFYCYRGVSE